MATTSGYATTDHNRQGRLFTDGGKLLCTVVEVTSGKGHAETTLINSRDSAHGFSFVHACVTIALTGEVAQICLHT